MKREEKEGKEEERGREGLIYSNILLHKIL